MHQAVIIFLYVKLAPSIFLYVCGAETTKIVKMFYSPKNVAKNYSLIHRSWGDIKNVNYLHCWQIFCNFAFDIGFGVNLYINADDYMKE